MNSISSIAGYYRVNRPQVAFESFGDETLLVNLESGCYYSLRGCSGQVLELIEKGYRVDAINASLSREFSGDPADIQAQITHFVEELTTEGILVPGGSSSDPSPTGEATNGDVAAPASRPPFQPPAVEKFSDMQDLLLLDPIHEVDEMGWPHQPIRE